MTTGSNDGNIMDKKRGEHSKSASNEPACAPEADLQQPLGPAAHMLW